MQITYCSEFNEYGVKSTGNLVVIHYWQDSIAHARTLPLEGYGKMTCFTYLDKAKERLRNFESKARIILSIPVLVARLSEEVIDDNRDD